MIETISSGLSPWRGNKAARRINPAGGDAAPDPYQSRHWEFSSHQDHADLA